ncbi:MAG: NAD-dependent epimerase/dehydratase family protein [Betaproteobacteria bacterium]|nr:NAD-dependent epimerase/dehydratase family protein [Betaproteobacteria bacterium]
MSGILPCRAIIWVMKRQPTLLMVGCGDVGLRVLRELRRRRSAWRILALTSRPDRRAELRAAGAVPIVGNLDDAATLGRLAGLCDAVLHLAPPPLQGLTDPRTAHLLQALSRRRAPRRLVYMSTTGVYGDCKGQWVPETRPVNPQSDRARRRVDAEQSVRAWARRTGGCATVLRVPGIYALDREGGDPRDRVRRGTPGLVREEDGYTNHIQADDLALIVLAALHRGLPQRVYNSSDDGDRLTGDHYDRVADLCGLPRPPREQARTCLSPMQLSFWGESRRLLNHRMKQELGVRLRYPSVDHALQAGPATDSLLVAASRSEPSLEDRLSADAG